MLDVIQVINQILWDYILIFLLLGTGVFYTFALKGVQVRGLFKGLKLMVSPSEKSHGRGMSSFQALSTSIAAQVGTGNLAGAATAIVAGGPGAIFWMWVSAFFGMSSIFAEAVLAQIYREEIDGEYVGGSAYYIEKGLGSKKLAICFALSLIVALGIIGNMVQANSIGHAFETAFNISPIMIGPFIAIAAGLIFLGGMKRIALFVEIVVPVMAVFYIVGCLYILWLRRDFLGNAFSMIFTGAFNPKALLGGGAGIGIRQAIRYGVSRGLFSNEAGMGSTPHAHAVAKVKYPFQQGYVAIFGVFFDTFIILNLTAFVILSSQFYLDQFSLGSLSQGAFGIALTQGAFLSSLGPKGQYFIAIILLFFAFSTIIGWYYFASANVKYLWGTKAIPYFIVLVMVCICLGCAFKVELIWELADTFNAPMVIINLVALIGLFRVVRKASHCPPT